ncbi:N-acetylmuramoyl-L-alanine amidase [Peribacillus simplex]|uniref:peptidoglycan recognition protein family protein n=1 Tax=Peribacillus simplex TaxID=1478 RepID=UPI0010BEF6E6|nr:N-acetylmuramoyl-L-alanine amidase [Peribacillus simplex]TKH04809.1 N-acetylmuramoyl-L-alanine amidase [Peribacillus simplex]
MDIIEDFIPAGRKNRPGRKINGPCFITIHDTANPEKGTDALNHARYLKGDHAAELPISWHFTVDDTRVVQHLPLTEMGLHAGDGGEGPGNSTSIGIEICENADGNRTKAEDHASELVAKLLIDLKLGIGAVVQHNKWNGKDCPHIIRKRQDGWSIFLESIKQKMHQI